MLDNLVSVFFTIKQMHFKHGVYRFWQSFCMSQTLCKELGSPFGQMCVQAILMSLAHAGMFSGGGATRSCPDSLDAPGTLLGNDETRTSYKPSHTHVNTYRPSLSEGLVSDITQITLDHHKMPLC